jgi:hypothetical protein
MHTKLLLTTIALTALCSASGLAADAEKPNADQILRQMSDTLAGAQQFSVKAHRSMDAALVPGGVAIRNARINATVQRPNRLTAHSAGGSDARRFIFDGRTLTLHDEKNNLYATVPMRKSIDGLVDTLDEEYGFTLPLAEFVLSNPYKDLHRQADTISYVGRGKVGGFLGIGGTECHRLALTGSLADAELWVGVADHLPYRLVATFKRHPALPQLRADFSSWNLAAKVSDRDFTFAPPAGAMKIEMVKQAKN